MRGAREGSGLLGGVGGGLEGAGSEPEVHGQHWRLNKSFYSPAACLKCS